MGKVCKNRCEMDSVFAAVASPACASIAGILNHQAEQSVYDLSFNDLINTRGIPVNYYINTYNLSAADNLYGEHPTARFYGPIPLMMYVELQEDAISFTNLGIVSDDAITAYVHIDTFVNTMSGVDYNILTDNGSILTALNVMDLIGYDKPHENNGQDIEPKAGDLIELEILGCDRPGNRGAKIFELTEETDQDMAALNPMLGHYIWRLRGKRYEHSFELGAPADFTQIAPMETGNDQVYDNSFSGLLSGYKEPSPLLTEDGENLILTGDGSDYIVADNADDSSLSTPEKKYNDDVDTDAKNIFDKKGADDIYGGYY